MTDLVSGERIDVSDVALVNDAAVSEALGFSFIAESLSNHGPISTSLEDSFGTGNFCA